ncbi:MAG TPA: CHASE3 domain-containing protein, partial [Thermoanaerobaculia bacterium]|nr:CHASE3 domain-containing protein [Thermoanaerobaculia bacterium]
MQQLSIARKGALLIVLPLVTQLTFGIALLVFGRSAVQAHGWELHSQKVLEQATDGRSSLVESQSALRGYVLSGVPSFRVSCNQAAREARENLNALRPLLADNPEQLQRLGKMSSIAEEFLGFQELNARLVEAGRRDAAEANVASRNGDRLMKSFLQVMNGFVDEERRLAVERHDRASRANENAIIVVAASLVLNAGIAGFLAFVFAAAINRRLNVLTENARRLATELPLLPPLSPGDEIAIVDRGFHDMAATLARSVDDLQRANREMEAFSYS